MISKSCGRDGRTADPARRKELDGTNPLMESEEASPLASRFRIFSETPGKRKEDPKRISGSSFFLFRSGIT
ncbi:MAG: hypothetical protein C6P37_02430 [Caldibacillus debilis]|uniref:Uncharacterized protein n=1 Tax=Caldibacillus debilis TaxID=301148 RepID=A0A3E0K897_9BACI|nr:MAG: hypothetical protein C6P37_02430 [Caldibacillus debilis]